MPCDTKLKPKQTISQRKEEIRTIITKLSSSLISGKVKAIIGPQGAITFTNFSEVERDGVTDACAYRRLMSTGSALAKQAIAKAEQLSGRTIDKNAIAIGHHSHDGGKTWHQGH